MKHRRRRKKFPFHHHTPVNQPGEAPMSSLKNGEKGVVIGIAGGRGILERMTSLGFVPGSEVIILQNFGHGPVIVRVHDARIALGRTVASRIRLRRSKA